MAKSKDGNNTSGMTDERGRESTTAEGGQRRDKSVSREVLGRSVEVLGERLERVEHISNELERHVFGEFERVKDDTIETDIRLAKLEETVMGAVQVLRESIEGMRTRIEAMEEDLALCKRVAANEGAGITATRSARVEYPRPSRFNGVRDAKEVENFLWEMELYFENLDLTDESVKIKTATSYLADTAMLWWRRRHAEIERGITQVDTWNEFKRDLKRQFYPENVVYQARKKLRELRQRGTIRDYVNEFTSLMLQIPSITEDESVFYFIDGLQNWAKQELQRREICSVDEAIAAAESLSDFTTHDRPKSYERHDGHSTNGGGDDRGSRHISARRDEYGADSEKGKPSHSKGFGRSSSREEYEERKKSFAPKGGCYVCKGPHPARKCPKFSSLHATTEKGESEEDSEDEPAMMGSLQLLNALVTKPERKITGRELMFVDAKVNGKSTKAMVDTGATNNFISEEEAKKLGITWKKREKWVKTVNSKAQPIAGIAKGVDFRMGEWKGRADFSVVPMDDFRVLLGLNFMKKIGAVPIPALNTIAILEKGNPCMIPTISVPSKKWNGVGRVSAMRIVEHPTSRGSNHGRVKSDRAITPSSGSWRINTKTRANERGADKKTHDDEGVAKMGGGECHALNFPTEKNSVNGRVGEVPESVLSHF